MMRLLLPAALAALIALPAAALEAPKDYAGKWTLSGLSEGDEVCTLKLTSEEAIGGWGVVLAKDCAARFGLPADDIAAWTLYPDGAIGFIDPLRHVVLKFTPVEIGGYVAERAKGEPIALDRVNTAPPPSEKDRMSGRWVAASMGTPLCGWISTSNAAGTAGKLKRDGACDKAWAAKGIAGWKRANGKLMLLDAKGKTVRTLQGDSIEGFFSPLTSAESLGFVRDRD